MGQFAAPVYANPHENFVTHENMNPKNAIKVPAVITRSGKTLKQRPRLDNFDAQSVVENDEPPKVIGVTQTKEVYSEPKKTVKEGIIEAPIYIASNQDNSSFSSKIDEETLQ